MNDDQSPYDDPSIWDYLQKKEYCHLDSCPGYTPCVSTCAPRKSHDDSLCCSYHPPQATEHSCMMLETTKTLCEASSFNEKKKLRATKFSPSTRDEWWCPSIPTGANCCEANKERDDGRMRKRKC